MAQSKKYKNHPVQLYALVVNYLLIVFILTAGGYLLGKYVIYKTTLAGGIIATIGAIVGIIQFVYGMLKIDKEDKDETKSNV